MPLDYANFPATKADITAGFGAQWQSSHTNANAWLMSGGYASAASAGTALDNRVAPAQGFLYYRCSSMGGGVAASATFALEVSPDTTAWFVAATLTATATQSGYALTSAWYPYLRVTVVNSWTATAATPSGTASLYVQYIGGVPT